MLKRIKVKKVRVAIAYVYRSRGEVEGWKVIRRWMEKKEEGRVFIQGDISAYTGDQEGEV